MQLARVARLGTWLLLLLGLPNAILPAHEISDAARDLARINAAYEHIDTILIDVTSSYYADGGTKANETQRYRFYKCGTGLYTRMDNSENFSDGNYSISINHTAKYLFVSAGPKAAPVHTAILPVSIDSVIRKYCDSAHYREADAGVGMWSLWMRGSQCRRVDVRFAKQTWMVTGMTLHLRAGLDAEHSNPGAAGRIHLRYEYPDTGTAAGLPSRAGYFIVEQNGELQAAEAFRDYTLLNTLETP